MADIKIQTPKGHGLGLVVDAPDERDHAFEATAPAPYQFVDLSKNSYMPDIWNQLKLGACTAHGTLAAFLYKSAQNGSDDPMLSRLMQYYLTRQIEGTIDQDAGGQIRDAIKASAMGIAPETDWPYNIKKFAQTPSVGAFSEATGNKDVSYKRVSKSANAIQTAFNAGYPIVGGYSLFPSFESEEALYETAFVDMPSEDDLEQGSIGGHCMLKVGIGTGTDWHNDGQFLAASLNPTLRYVKMRNSWGVGVYQQGYLLMPLSYFTSEYGSDYWIIENVT